MRLTRGTVIIRGLLDGGKEFACSAWTNMYLKDVAGGGEIEVERRESTSQQFGRGTVKVHPLPSPHHYACSLMRMRDG